jgi:hypothetical protein
MKTATYFISMICLLLIAGISYGQEVKINTDLVVEADGTLKFLNGATVFDDMMVYPDATTRGGSNDPTWGKFKDNGSGSQGVFLMWFDDDTEQEVYFCMQIPHSYKVGSTLYPHVHWTTSSGTPTTTNVVWGLEYSVVAIGGTYSTTTIITGNNILAAISPTGTGQHLITSLGTISGTGLGISTVLVCRLYRKAGDALDTFSSSTGLLGVDFHFEKDTEGSRGEYTK